MPGLQKLAYAGKNFEDSGRTLEQCAPRQLAKGAWLTRRAPRSYGVRYWHAKFPHWPLTIRRH